MPIHAIGGINPTIDPTAFVSPEATVAGDVHIGPEASIWPFAELRGDGHRIEVGAQTSIQDHATVRVTDARGTRIGARCIVGHLAQLEGCEVHDGSLVGSASVVAEDAVIGPRSLVGAGAHLGAGAVVPPAALAVGRPARIIENAVDAAQAIDPGVQRYVDRVALYRSELRLLR
jgi:carbonic anhydrase/acetyltransferase-like protein (isoleucine patch superfamily)